MDDEASAAAWGQDALWWFRASVQRSLLKVLTLFCCARQHVSFEGDCGTFPEASEPPVQKKTAAPELGSEGEEVEAEANENGAKASAAPLVEQQRGVWELGGLTFSSDFDSGNCSGVTEVSGQGGCRTFRVRVRSDCEGTRTETAECAWFYFRVSGELFQGQRLEFQVYNPAHKLKLRRLLYDGMKPVMQSRPSARDWRFVSGKSTLRVLKDGSLALVFSHTVERCKVGEVLSFATCFPYPLEAATELVSTFETRMRNSGAYVHHECLCDSLQGRPVELITVSGAGGRSEERQPPIPGLEPRGPRPHIFPNRRAVFISARVHPGETPASYVLEGLLKALAGARRGLNAEELLQRYVFFIVPVLNPDGVFLGYHRTDSRGVNLNRMYGQAESLNHAPIFAAEGACLAAHQCQGGIRLYLDLHAHGSRRGCFAFADSAAEGLAASAQLYCYSLARRCPIFEYPQCVFSHSSEGTGKSVMSTRLEGALCFTLETNYCRGHHSTEPFTPPAWFDLGASCLDALLDLDTLQGSGGPQPVLSPATAEDDGTEAPAAEEASAVWRFPVVDTERGRALAEAGFHTAAMWLAASCSAGAGSLEELPGLTITEPCRACPAFAVIQGPSENFNPSVELWPHPECFGQQVEFIGRRSLQDTELSYKADVPGVGLLWVRERDLVMQEDMSGRFFYRALLDTPVTEGPELDSNLSHVVRSGTLLEACERRVVRGFLRVLIVGCEGGLKAGWASEFRSVAFDPRLGGDVQLMRLKALPGSK